MSRFQGTVPQEVRISGVGLHSGREVTLRIFPAAPNNGIVFFRTDLSHSAPIWAHPQSVSATQLSTTIGPQGAAISTIEHLMAAFSGVGIDNARVEVDGPEIPILDGSSRCFVEKFLEVGVQVQNVPRKIVALHRPFTVGTADHFIRYEPWGFLPESSKKQPPLLIEGFIDFTASQVIGQQSLLFSFTEANFLSLHEARTFCHIQDIETMRAQGLAKGGSLENAVVVDHEQVLNPEGLRAADEFIRHKILDFIGDMALLGFRLSGKVVLHKGGHRLHVDFAKEVLRQAELELAQQNVGIGSYLRALSPFSR